MLNLSKIHLEIQRIKNESVKHPKTDKQLYWQYYFRLESHFQDLIDDVLLGQDIVYPITTKPIEQYLSGFTIFYHPFEKYKIGKPNLEGCWFQDEDDFLLFMYCIIRRMLLLRDNDLR
jgi:hypothetical protein